ncbi:hypothetical protein AMATHDRAFT_55992 [Amanita thiersii Skay4041]|uniref:Membrane anchor Opy2 N-terminal domain-containing protein n=1 Tax=Amanita thiersii Skay4041 TaxID=703135 RepID=A0A2A9NWH0_9AGAR|nr:hypothetical protein AMATHDRAFT_55992 [Amanita thiersii Skay4041]
MRIDPLFPRQSSDDCIKCPDPTPCSCTPDQDCIQINRDCHSCSRTTCVARPSSSNNTSSGVSKGALAGGIIGALLFLGFALGLFLCYRRRSRRLRAIAAANREIKKDVPAPAETVLNRPNPTEKLPPSPSEMGIIRNYPMASTTTINLDPQSQDASRHTSNAASFHTPSNPFDDDHSIQTAKTEGTNVIPIALVPPESFCTRTSQADSSTTSQPSRPPRSPELNLNLDHVNVSHDSLRAPNYPVSTRSGFSTSSRNSYMSSASYSSDFLNEAPMIVTPGKTAVRQVLGVVKAEVISATSLTTDSLKPPSSKPTIGSPLASSSFGPADVVKELDESQETTDPFSDKHSSTYAVYGVSPAPAVSTFGQGSQPPTPSDWIPEQPKLPWGSFNDGSSRPSSLSTQAGSTIDIGNAKRVNVSEALSPDRTTMARLISPVNMTTVGNLQQQQQRALAHAQAQAQGLDQTRRVSGSSVISATSTRSYSILESFPIVPPSPISDRPIRSPQSPLSQQSFTVKPSSPLAQHSFNVTPPTPNSQNTFNDEADTASQNNDLPAPPNRRILALSTVSTASSGLGSFPFQIETGTGPEVNPPVPTNGRQRASLDTLALTSDLSSYPLGFDRDSIQMPLPPLPKNI